MQVDLAGLAKALDDIRELLSPEEPVDYMRGTIGMAAECIRRTGALERVIDLEIAEIEADARYHDAPALVQVNAPLALIQVEMKGSMCVLKRLRATLNKGGS